MGFDPDGEWRVDVLMMQPGNVLSHVLLNPPFLNDLNGLVMIFLIIVRDHLIVLGIGLAGSRVHIHEVRDLLEVGDELVRGDELFALKVEF